MNKAFLITLISLTGLCLKAQINPPDPQAGLDSLYAVWEDESQADSLRVTAYSNYIRKGFLNNNPDSAIILADELLAFGKKKNYPKARASGFSIKGQSHYYRFDYPKALDYLSQSLKIKEQLGDQRGISITLKMIGVIYFRQGDDPKALDYYTQSLEIAEQLGDQQEILDPLNNIALVYSRQGDYPKALDYFTQSLEIAEQLTDQQTMANVLANIGLVYSHQGDGPKALDYFTQSIEINEQLTNQRSIARVLHFIVLVYERQGDYSKALDYLSQSLEISKQLGAQGMIAASLNSIGGIYAQQGDDSKALDYLSQSLEIYEQLTDQREIANVLLNIGVIYKQQDDYPKALNYFTQGLKIKEQLSDQRGISGALNSIGNLYGDQGDYSTALDYLSQSLEIYEQLTDKPSIANVLLNIGQAYGEQGDYLKALDYCQKSYEMALSVGVLSIQKANCKCLYENFKALGNSNKALVYMEKMRVVEDSLNSEETSKKLQQMEFAKQMLQDSIAQVETDRLVLEAHQEEVRQKNRTRNLLAGGGLVLFILAGGIYSRLRYTRKAKAIVEKEKDRSNNLLLNILPADIAEELKIHGKAEARDFDMVSILFTDFKGFTAASAKLSAAELVSEINTCFEAFDHIMGKYNIEKIKTIGDAYMAAGGLPVPTDDSIKNTVLAALEMQDFIGKRKVEMDTAGKPAFEMRVGIHTGPVVAGIVGVKKFQYDIWGDTVNTAARMESSGAVGKVNISQATYELLKDPSTALSASSDFSFESRGKIEAKGKGEIDMYFVSKT